ncbi:hypothetical protein OAD71_03420 [Gammaproteobacteria bacterium]|nr:hypothetical protein [Gammaproteobacteria bacterium]
MKHTLAIVLIVCGIVGCAVSTPLLVDFRDPDTKYGDWNYSKLTDEFNGNFLMSFVQSTDNIAYMRVLTSLNTNGSRFEYANGDSYICVLYSSLKAEMIFYKDGKEALRQEPFLTISTDNKVLGHTNLGSGENQFNQLLNRYDKLKIRTTDTCGTVITKTFNIKGTTHLRPMES